MDETTRRIGLAVALVAIVGAIVVVEAPWAPSSQVPPPPEDLPDEAAQYPPAANFAGATAWVQSEPLDLVDLRGQVVVVDFWTYSCINCINTFPYLRAWHEAYEDDGLVIVGVHTPEFRFERDVDNVRAAAERYGLEHPIAIDNRYEIWNAYHNRYWPAKYLIDQHGRIRDTHFGEGAYNRTEDTIRELLTEAGREPDNDALHLYAKGGGVRAFQTPELFASHLDGRKHHAIGNEEGYHPGETIDYARPDEVVRDKVFLVGTWKNEGQRVVAAGPDASVLLRFRAGGMNFVADALDDQCVNVMLDGETWPRYLAGPDVSHVAGGACLVLDADRAYDVYSGPFEEHLAEIEAPEGFALYSFAFSAEGREAP